MAHTATLEVPPKQAEVVALVGEMGKLAMTLRSLGTAASDAEDQSHSMTWDSDATDIGQKPHTPGTADDSAKVSVTRGTTDTVVDFSKVAK